MAVPKSLMIKQHAGWRWVYLPSFYPTLIAPRKSHVMRMFHECQVYLHTSFITVARDAVPVLPCWVGRHVTPRQAFMEPFLVFSFLAARRARRVKNEMNSWNIKQICFMARRCLEVSLPG